VLPWSTYTGTKLETADTAKDYLQRAGLSPTRRDTRIGRYFRVARDPGPSKRKVW
jgi:hypothetical protein